MRALDASQTYSSKLEHEYQMNKVSFTWVKVFHMKLEIVDFKQDFFSFLWMIQTFLPKKEWFKHQLQSLKKRGKLENDFRNASGWKKAEKGPKARKKVLPFLKVKWTVKRFVRKTLFPNHDFKSFLIILSSF